MKTKKYLKMAATTALLFNMLLSGTIANASTRLDGATLADLKELILKQQKTA